MDKLNRCGAFSFHRQHVTALAFRPLLVHNRRRRYIKFYRLPPEIAQRLREYFYETRVTRQAATALSQQHAHAFLGMQCR